jgi:hypothetical protein
MKKLLIVVMMMVLKGASAHAEASSKFCLSDTMGIINGKRVCVACKSGQKSKYSSKEACEKGGK